MPQRDELYVADMVEAAQEIAGWLHGVTRQRWDADSMLRNAVLYKLLILGEIARSLTEELREKYPQIPWRAIRGFRNVAVHQYFGVDWAVVWKLAKDEAPKLKDAALAILRAEFPDIAARFETSDQHS